jgi:hypothetical protein
MRSWKQEPPKSPKEKATAELLQSLRSQPTLSPEALARVGRKVRANARAPESRWVTILAGLRLPAVAGALGSVAIVGGLTYVALERRPSVELPGEEKVAIAPAGPLKMAEEAKPVPSAGARPPPPSAEDKGELPEVLAKAKKDQRAVGQPARLQPQPFTGLAAGGGAAGLARSAPADRAEPQSIGALGGRTSAKASDSVGSLQGGAEPEPRMASRKAAAPPPAELADMRRPATNSQFAGAPPPAAPSVAANQAPSGAPMAREREPAAAAQPDDAALVDNAEQLAATGRCADAIVPFSIVADGAGDGPLVERALFGRGRCYLRLHQDAAGRQDLETYLTRFPSGRYAAQTRGLLH